MQGRLNCSSFPLLSEKVGDHGLGSPFCVSRSYSSHRWRVDEGEGCRQPVSRATKYGDDNLRPHLALPCGVCADAVGEVCMPPMFLRG